MQRILCSYCLMVMTNNRASDGDHSPATFANTYLGEPRCPWQKLKVVLHADWKRERSYEGSQMYKVVHEGKEREINRVGREKQESQPV